MFFCSHQSATEGTIYRKSTSFLTPLARYLTPFDQTKSPADQSQWQTSDNDRGLQTATRHLENSSSEFIDRHLSPPSSPGEAEVYLTPPDSPPTPHYSYRNAKENNNLLGIQYPPHDSSSSRASPSPLINPKRAGFERFLSSPSVSLDSRAFSSVSDSYQLKTLSKNAPNSNHTPRRDLDNNNKQPLTSLSMQSVVQNSQKAFNKVNPHSNPDHYNHNGRNSVANSAPLSKKYKHLDVGYSEYQ